LLQAQKEFWFLSLQTKNREERTFVNSEEALITIRVLEACLESNRLKNTVEFLEE
jgi:hypothetical protein